MTYLMANGKSGDVHIRNFAETGVVMGKIDILSHVESNYCPSTECQFAIERQVRFIIRSKATNQNNSYHSWKLLKYTGYQISKHIYLT